MKDLGKSIWTNDEFQAFARNENKNNYQNYKKQLEDDYDKNYSFTGNFMNWLGNGLSGGGWTKNGFLENRGITPEIDNYSEAIGASDLNTLRKYGSEYNKSRNAQLEAGKDLFSGVPLLGTIISPMAQVTSAGKDLATSGTEKWQNGKRDLTSDIGALGDTALTLATLGTGATAGSLGKSVAKGALTGAGYGAFGTMNELGNNTWTPEGLGNLALSTGIGAGVGGGLSGIGYGVNKLATGAQNARNMASAYQDYMNQAGGQTTNLLGDGVGGASVTSNPNIEWLNSRGKLAKTKLGQAAQGIGDIASLAKANGVNPLSKITNSKVGKATSKILKTKTGKIGAGVGAGLVLNKVLNGKKNQELSDEEADELYNYYYGGQ